MQGDPAHHLLPVDDGHPATEFGGCDGSFLAARSGPNHKHVKVGHGPSLASDDAPLEEESPVNRPGQ
ncbi:hypothetical protein SANT12839_086540 [Streptomyces antimycoticus]|uniref:Uncharacterized protein n=1 Tax=Streptomyces antimycoticus TaxID=68175 RepID=A0A4D4KH86_9ACTN|nr:hypothetical protein SANT12839_086540 [Streptomyces antimycoticus]